MTDAVRKPGRWKTWALVGSIAINLVLVGMLGGIALRGGPDGGLMRAAISALPKQERRDMYHEGRGVWKTARTRAEHRAARAQMLDALRAEEFDAARFRAALDATQALLLGAGDRLEDRLIARLERLDADERRQMADRLERRTQRHLKQSEGGAR